MHYILVSRLLGFLFIYFGCDTYSHATPALLNVFVRGCNEFASKFRWVARIIWLLATNAFVCCVTCTCIRNSHDSGIRDQSQSLQTLSLQRSRYILIVPYIQAVDTRCLKAISSSTVHSLCYYHYYATFMTVSCKERRDDWRDIVRNVAHHNIVCPFFR